MLPKVDSKILFALDSNARESYSKIAKDIGTSKQVVSSHVSRLLAERKIKKFLTIFDLSRLDFIVHKVYLRLIHVSAKGEEEILRYFENHKNVAWLVRTEGVYDLALAFHTKDIVELNRILLEMENKFGYFISEKVINRVVTGEFFHRDYFLEKKRSELRKNVVFQSLEKSVRLDAVDYQIMAALARNSRTSAVEIAKKVPLTADAIGKRIKSLEKAGVIKNYIIVIDDNQLQQLHYKVLLKVSNFPEAIEKKFLEFCRQHKNIVFYNKNIGSWEIEIDLEVQKSEDFREIMRTIKTEFADSVREYFSLMLYDIRKFDFLPMHHF